MIVRWLLVLLTLLAVGCGQPHEDTCVLWIDSRFTQEQHDIIVLATQQWEFAVGGRTHTIIDDGYPPQPGAHGAVWLTADDPIVATFDDEANGMVLGWAQMRDWWGFPDVGPIFFIADRIENFIDERPGLWQHVTLHELGHHWGISHEDKPDDVSSVMRPNADPGSDCITDADIDAFCNIYGCEGYITTSTCAY